MARRIPELLAHLQVCAEGFEDEDATVVCRQLGYVIPGQPAKGRALPGFPKCVGQDCWSGWAHACTSAQHGLWADWLQRHMWV